MNPLSFYEAVHLLKIENEKHEALELIAKLADSGQITSETEIKPKDWVALFIG
jgi:hypothetical protein